MRTQKKRQKKPQDMQRRTHGSASLPSERHRLIMASRKETAFTLRYTAKETDIIPDFIPEIGYADDSLIVRTVLNRHQDVFHEYCRFRNIRWENSIFAH